MNKTKIINNLRQFYNDNTLKENEEIAVLNLIELLGGEIQW